MFIQLNMSEGSDNGSLKLSQSQVSMNSQISSESKQNTSQQEEENPFLKRKATHEDLDARKKEISEHVEKYGIKKKIDERKMGNKGRL